jgi:thioredoxin-like negative regulator of GroEL
MAERLLVTLVLLAVMGAAVLLVRRELARRRRERMGCLLGDLLPQARRGPAIVYLTTPYCAVCRAVQAPALHRLRAHTGDAVQFLTVNVLERPDVAGRLGVLSVPATAILDAEGRVRHVNYGPAGLEELLRQVAPFLSASASQRVREPAAAQ